MSSRSDAGGPPATGGEGKPDGGRAAVERWAPAASRLLRSLESAAWSAMAGGEGLLDRFDLAARVVAVQQGLRPLARPTQHGVSPWSDDQAAAWRRLADLDAADRAALEFAEQLGFDVASLAVDQRSALFERLGEVAASFAQAVYVADFLPRARHALDRLFGASDWSERSDGADGMPAPDLQDAIDELIRVVPQLQNLDPVTTELVRLLGARRHQCRICQSLRSRSALVAGADDAMFAAVDDYAASGLSDAHKSALAFTEAIVATPGRITDDRIEALRAHFAPAARVELVLDVLRNACNKVAVALAADTARVEEGYEIYDVSPEGELLYDLEAP